MISAIILTWNSERYIKKCIESLTESAKETREDLEILLFDNGSKDNTLKITEDLSQRFPFVLLTKLGENKGTTFPRNLGIKKAKGEYILILDSDTEFKKKTIKTLLATLTSDPKIGIVAPKLILPNGEIQKSYKRFPILKTKIFKALSFKQIQNMGRKEENYAFRINKSKLYPVDYCIAAIWLLKKEVVRKVGLFDENIFYGPEDVDYCLRTWLNGYKVVFVPAAEAIHYTQRLSYKNKKIALRHIQGLFYYFKKHHYWLSRKKIYQRISKAISQSYPIND